MSAHVHGCLTCQPEMVPDFDLADPRYHAYEKCGRLTTVMLNGERQLYSVGAFEGPEGWVLFAGATQEDIHHCPRCYPPMQQAEHWGRPVRLCVEPRFGVVEVGHECPAQVRAMKRRIDQAIRYRAHVLEMRVRLQCACGTKFGAIAYQHDLDRPPIAACPNCRGQGGQQYALTLDRVGPS